MNRESGILLSLTGACLLSLVGTPIEAQYLGLNLRGDVGLKSGSLPGPGYYFVMPLFYQQDYTSVRGPSGNEIPGGFNARQNFFVPAFAATTKFKVAGANYGFSVVAPIVNQRLDVAMVGVQKGAGYNFADMYVQPVKLGWTTKRADFLAAYGFYAPTGVGSRSLNMWGHELIAGTTVYFDDAKKWHAASTMFYEIHHQRSTDQIRPGDFLTLEGGVGRSFLKGAGNAGLAYVAQWKTTSDSGRAIPPLFPKGGNKAYGLGPELTLPFFAKGTTVGLIGFRYTFEMGNQTNFQGRNLVLSLTLAKFNP